MSLSPLTRARWCRRFRPMEPFPAGVDLGAEMVRQDWAVATGDAYLIEKAEARAGRRGIWRGRFSHPADWRAAHARPAGALASPDA